MAATISNPILFRRTKLLTWLLLAASVAFPFANASAQEPPPAPETPEVPTPNPAVPDLPPPIPDALSSLTVPTVPGIGEYIQNQAAAVALGKALFWDMSAGSDGLACASCHFHAGADNRVKNQVSPGLLRQDLAGAAPTFDATASGSNASGPNYVLRSGDFPFHQFNDPDNRESGVKFSTDDVVSSQGTLGGTFSSPGSMFDNCARTPDATYNVRGTGVRKVEPRNTPTMINAVFNFRNFWDGRANNVFNGMNPFGPRDASKKILKWNANGSVTPVTVSLSNSSLASQSVGPPLSNFEMSCQGRTFPDLGGKLLPMKALSSQHVASDDSVLKPYRAAVGLTKTYADLIKAAFQPAWWKASGKFDGRTQMEANFSLFWGLAIQAYESTLVSDQAPFDNWVRAGKPESGVPGFGPAEIRGLRNVFMSKGGCINCHGGPAFSNAAMVMQPDGKGPVEGMLMGDHAPALYDDGFYNIGVTPTAHDIGVGGTDPIIGAPLSFAEQYRQSLLGVTPLDSFKVDPCQFAVLLNGDCTVPLAPTIRTAVAGAFKVPSLRNVELTGPYMHNGSMATLEQVIQFYNRGGNFQNPELDADIGRIGLSVDEKADLLAFLKSLTDPRVRYERAPFDRPELLLPNGQTGDENAVKRLAGSKMAADDLVILPAVGRNGGPPVLAFAATLDGSGGSQGAKSSPFPLAFATSMFGCSVAPARATDSRLAMMALVTIALFWILRRHREDS